MDGPGAPIEEALGRVSTHLRRASPLIAFSAILLLLLAGTGRTSEVMALGLGAILALAGPPRLVLLGAAMIGSVAVLAIVGGLSSGFGGASLLDPLSGLRFGLEWLAVPLCVALVFILVLGDARRRIPDVALAAGVVVGSLLALSALAVRLHLPERSVLVAVLALVVLWSIAGAGLVGRSRIESVGGARVAIAAVVSLVVGALTLPTISEPVYRPGRSGIVLSEADLSGGSGLFGAFVDMLENAGEEVVRLPDLSSDLGRFDRLVVLSTDRSPTPAELEAVDAWVSRGGRLVVGGEHTNLEGAAERLNPLLTSYGIRLRFDTTNGLLGDRVAHASALDSTGGRLLALSPTLQIGRGASLEVRRPARAAITGTWWHGDAGDPDAPERAFLSDYGFSEGDQLGGLVLVATAEVGEGRVVALGDSEPFLETHLATSSLALLDLLGGEDHRALGPTLALAALLILTLALLLPALRTPGQLAPRLLVVSAALVLLASTAWSSGARSLTGPLESLAVLSASENNSFDRDPFEPSGFGALTTSLVDAGYVPHVGSWQELDQPPRAVVIANPNRLPSKAAWRRLLAWVDAGTLLVLSGGAEEEVFVELASRLGVEVGAEPLGHARGSRLETHEAWPILRAPAGSRLLGVRGHPVVASWSRGRGHVWIFADRGFLQSKNLRHDGFVDQRNLELVASMLERRDD